MTPFSPTGGLHPEQTVTILRDKKRLAIAAAEVQPGDFVESMRRFWRVQTVVLRKQADPGWRLELEDGRILKLASGTLIAGIAGWQLPSERNSRPSVCLVRHEVDTGAARRRYKVLLLNPHMADPSLRRFFRTKSQGKASDPAHRVFYFLHQATQFLEGIRNALPDTPIFSGVEINVPLGTGHPKFRIRGDHACHPIFPLFEVGSTSRAPVAVATLEGSSGRWRYNNWRIVRSWRRLEADPAIPWVCPVFLRSQEDDESEQLPYRNPLVIVADQVACFAADGFANRRLFDSTHDSLLAFEPIPERPHPEPLLSSVVARAPVCSRAPITLPEAVDGLTELVLRMRASGLQAGEVLHLAIEQLRDAQGTAPVVEQQEPENSIATGTRPTPEAV